MTDALGNSSDDTSEELLELRAVMSVLDSAGVAFAVLADNSSVLHTNPAFARTCGRPAPELQDQPLTRWVIEEDADTLSAIAGEVADGATSGQPAHSTDARFVGADGKVRPVRLHLDLVAGGDRGLLVCIAQDRSEDRRRARSDRSAKVARAVAEATDEETGLPNKRGLEEALASASRRSRNNRAPHALIRCELTLAEQQADTPGDGGGAAGTGVPSTTVLHSCIDRVRQRLRPADTIARPDEVALAIVAEDLHDEQDAVGVAYRLLSTVVEPVPDNGGEVELRMVIGLVMADGSTPPNALISAAGEAAADARGPGGFVLMDLRDLSV